MNKKLLSLSLLFLNLSLLNIVSVFSDTQIRNPRGNVSVTQEEQESYTLIVDNVIEKIIALKEEYPHFSEIASAKIERSPFPYGISLKYSHNCQWLDQKIEPGNKIGGIKSCSEKDGVSIEMEFFVGSSRSAQWLPTLTIDKLQIEYLIEGGNTDIQKHIYNILLREKENYDRGHQ